MKAVEQTHRDLNEDWQKLKQIHLNLKRDVEILRRKMEV